MTHRTHRTTMRIGVFAVMAIAVAVSWTVLAETGFDISPSGVVGGGGESIGGPYSLTGGILAIPLDSDADGVPDALDNAPSDFNPDQSDIDGDLIGDVADPCPSDFFNTCDPDGSTAEFIDAEAGGTIATADKTAKLEIPPEALDGDFTISVTDSDSTTTGFELTTNKGAAVGVFSLDIQPSGTIFGIPVTVTFTWDDADDNGRVDGTNIQEDNLRVTKDKSEIVSKCKNHSPPDAVLPDCDTVANTLTFQITSLSEFVLLAPQDTDDDGVPDNYEGVIDACPTTFGLASLQGCPPRVDILVDLHTIDQVKPRTACPDDKGSCKEPIPGAEVRVFDRNDATFQSSYGTKNPDGAIYDQVFENDFGRVGSCVTDATGQCTAVEEAISDLLVIVKFAEVVDLETTKTVYSGKPRSSGDFDSTGLTSVDFQVIKVIRKTGPVQLGRGKKTVVTGSFLEIVSLDYAIWEEGITTFVYPFIFTADSDWTVDVCTEVPVGYQIIGVYDADGTLISSTDCVQTVLANDTKVVAFEVVDLESPPPHVKARFKIRHKGKLHQFDLDVPGRRKGKDKRPAR